MRNPALSSWSLTQWLLALVVGFAVTHVLFATWPGIDLRVAALFYDAGAGVFPLEKVAFLEAVRNLFWNLTIVFALGLLVAWGLSLALGPRVHVPHTIWLFGWSFFVLGPGILVNGVLKAHFGRARPAHLAEFGGDKLFTPPFQITDQCASNCSFVSGEGAAAVTVALVLAIMFWRWVRPDRHRLFVGLLVALVVMFAGMRIVKGRHFLSDVLLGGWMMALLALGLVWALGLHRDLPRFTPRAVAADIKLARARVWRPALVWLAGALGTRPRQ